MKTNNSEYFKSVNSKMRCFILFSLILCVAGFILLANLHRFERRPKPSRSSDAFRSSTPTDVARAASKKWRNVESDDDDEGMHKLSSKMLLRKSKNYLRVDDNIRKISRPSSPEVDVSARGQNNLAPNNIDQPMRVQKNIPVDNEDLPTRRQKGIPEDNEDQPIRVQKKTPEENVDQPVHVPTEFPPYNVAHQMHGNKNSPGGNDRNVDLTVRKQRNFPRYYAGQPASKQRYDPRGNIDQPIRDIRWKDSMGKDDPSEEITVIDLPQNNTSAGESSAQYLPPENKRDFSIEEWRRQNAKAVKNNEIYWKEKNALAVENGVKDWQGKNTSLGDLISVTDFPQNKSAVDLSVEKWWKNRNALAVENIVKHWKKKHAPLDNDREKDSPQKNVPAAKDRIKDSETAPLGLQTGDISVKDTPWGNKSMDDDVRMKGSPKYHKNINFLKELAFMPLYPITCEELFQHVTELEKSGFFTLEFLAGIRLLNEHLGRIVKQLDVTYVESHSGLFEKQQLATVRLVQMPFVRTVCETGFNAGHSTLLYLMANKNAQVYSFDIASHAYSKQMAMYIESEYPGRLHVTWGNSMTTIPDFHGHFPRVTCDVISVDGGQTAEVAYWDFVNFRKMAACRHLVLFHNYPDVQRKSSSIGRVWEGKKRSGELSELFRCQYKTKVHGFSLGRYNDLDNCDQV